MKEYDVIVVGGGFTGVAAAVTAARQGMRVLLTERTNCLGGAACNCLVNPFMPFFTGSKEDGGKKLILSAGIFDEIQDRLIKVTADICGDHPRYQHKPMSTFSEEALKIAFNRMVLEAGVDLLFHTTLVGADKDGDRITGLTMAGKAGLCKLHAFYYVDCTGDADLALQAGCPTHLGRPEDHLCQPMTLCFRVGDVDTARFREGRAEMQKAYKEQQAKGKIRNIREDVLVFNTLSDSILHFNTTRIVKLNPTDPVDVTRAEIEAREQVYEMMCFLRTYAAGCENAKLISTAMQIGMRESRMIDGEYVLTVEDLLAFRKFDDGIAACNYDIDIHNPEGSGTSHYYFPQGEYYTIPFRCLIPRGVDNLLVAGRCISSTHEAQASYRILPVVTTLGEAAGVGIAQACKANIPCRQVDASAVREILRANGAFF